MRDGEDEFYVGYEDEMPAGLRRFLRERLVGVLALAPLLLGVVAAAQGGFVASVFEFGREREFVGWVSERPVPALVLLRPGDAAHCGATSTYPIVSRGKHGAAERMAGLDGRAVRLRGTLIHLDGATLIEVSDDDPRPIDAPDPRPAARVESLGHHRFEGEIVDSKCHFGVMNPGSSKVHRACAARCISGGIPPALLIRDRRGHRAVLLLVGPDGRGIGREVLAWVGTPVAVEGEVVRHDDWLVLTIEPASIRAAGG